MTEREAETQEWLDKAVEDLRAGQILLKHSSGLYATVCFHCQQAAEKVLKAVLVWESEEFEKLHSLRYLLGLLYDIDESFGELEEEAELLTPYAVTIRYPVPGRSEINEHDAREALVACKRVWNVAQRHLPDWLRREFSQVEADNPT